MSLLQTLQQQGLLSPLSVAFARFIARHGAHEEDSLCVLTAALLSERNQQGDVCLHLAELASAPLFQPVPGVMTISAPALAQWQQALRESVCVGQVDDDAPLILEGTRLYLQRFQRYEASVSEAILGRLGEVEALDIPQLQKGLRELFSGGDGNVDWQQLASALALTRRFAVISGGPGTGKTTTAVRVLALLLQQAPDLRIRLAAPTGKAAARMVESIRAAKQRLHLDASLVSRLPDEASTLHRLLGYQGGVGRGFRHHARNPLPVDCLLIDEASMIDLPLMAALLAACRPGTRLILLGDRDQLASVEAGNVLGDITGHGQALSYTPEMAVQLQFLCGLQAPLPQAGEAPGIADSLAVLRTSHRFAADSGIGSLASAVNTGDVTAAQALLAQADESPDGLALNELVWLRPRESEWQPLNLRLLDWAVVRYREALASGDVGLALTAFGRTRILCAAHEGPLGERELNQLVQARLLAMGVLGGAEETHGMPVMITVNDYEMGLFNGDIGLLWRRADGVLEACFPEQGGQVRHLPAGSLPEHVPAWAMTVHKSQGSEFEEVALILPDDPASPLLLRELLYTGITRARNRLLLHTSAAALQRACLTPVRRSSGLAERLGWPALSGN